MIKTTRIETNNHAAFVQDARQALRDVAAMYAERIRKQLVKELKGDRYTLENVRVNIKDIVWCDLHPGNIPLDLDTPFVRREMQRLLLKAFK